MKKIITLLLFFIKLSTSIFAQNKVWDKTFGGAIFDFASCVVPTNDGGYLLGGTSPSPVSGNKTSIPIGSNDSWIVKVDINGIKQSELIFGGTTSDILTSLIKTQDGNYLLGAQSQATSGISSQFYLRKFDLSGNILNPSFPSYHGYIMEQGDGSYGQLPIVIEDGNYYYFGGTIYVGGSNYDDFEYSVTKVDKQNGNIIWEKIFGGVKSDFMNSLVIDGNDIMIGGWSNSPISGLKSQGVIGNYDFWVLKIDKVSGNKIWDKTYGTAYGENYLNSILPTGNGDYMLGGTSNGHYWITKINNLGTTIWNKTFGGYYRDDFFTMFPTIDGGYLIGGDSYSGISGDKTETNYGDYDIWILKIDDNGNKIWDKTLGGNYDDRIKSIVYSNNSYTIAGYSSSNISGTKTMNSFGGADYWLNNIQDNSPLPVLSLRNPYHNIYGGNNLSPLCTNNGNIVANNVIHPTAKIEYISNKSILLQPGFQAQAGTVFKAEIGGCQ